MYEKEKQLDEITHWAAARINQACTSHEIPLPISFEQKQELVNILISYGVLQLITVNMDKPITFHNFFSITPYGVRFANFDSFVTLAKQKHKADKRFDFEYFKIGFDSIIALISLLISIIALLFAIH